MSPDPDQPLAPPPDAAGRPLSVAELAMRVRRLLEEGIGRVVVEGEISNLRIPGSGHCYFMLKDATAAVSAVCFRGTLARQRCLPVEGMKVEVTGRLSAYAPRGEYQIIIESLREAGLGERMRRLLELKERLRAEGLFDLERKRALPRLPRRIALVTSADGAALRDMINVLGRRARGLEILLVPTMVQGEAAPARIVAALGLAARHGRAEVIILGRGGGSIEDLWAFNDERVVRAVAACPIPVITAVGHETDTTLVDYAADLRAPTPSAAAELVSAHHDEMLGQLCQWRDRLARAAQTLLAHQRARLERCRGSWGLRNPRERLAQAMQRIDELDERLGQVQRRALRRRAEELAVLARRLERVAPLARLAALRARLAHLDALLSARTRADWNMKLAASRAEWTQLAERLNQAARRRLEERRWQLRGASQRLEALSPLAILDRGYSIVTHGRHNRIVTNPDQLKLGQTVRIRSAGGPWRAAVLPNEDELFDQAD